MISAKNNPVQLILICALVFMTVFYYHHEMRHTEQLAAAEKSLARLRSTLATKELGRGGLARMKISLGC